jgi:site-specific recombinase XerD
MSVEDNDVLNFLKHPKFSEISEVISNQRSKDMEILNSFRDYMLENDRSPITIKGYLSDISQFSRWFEQSNGEPFSLTVVTPSDVREYRAFLQTIGRRKANTINRHLAALASLYNWALETSQVESDPTQKIRGINVGESGPHYLDKKQQYALKRAVERDIQVSKMRYPKRWIVRRRDGSLALFLQHTGLRLQEALSLRLSDIQLSDRKGSVLVRYGKGHKERTVPLNADVRKNLKEWLIVRPTERGDYLWMAVEKQVGCSLSSRSAERILQRIGQEAGLDRLTPHMLRHTFGKNLIDNGVSIEKVAQLMGHNNLNTTGIYVKPGPKDLEDAVEKIATADY